jgi:hypothetical protein
VKRRIVQRAFEFVFGSLGGEINERPRRRGDRQASVDANVFGIEGGGSVRADALVPWRLGSRDRRDPPIPQPGNDHRISYSEHTDRERDLRISS